jgi:glycosyltransferase involved in cell wall biosynthesis
VTDDARAPETVVDVGIPTYGQPAFLAQSIECVLAQSMPSWRLTISENGPGSDYVRRVVEPYLSDERVRYVATGSNLGGAGNSTSLLRGARAAYIALLHDDDLWAPDFLERRIAFLEGNPSCGLVFSCCDFIDDHGAVVHRFAPRLREGIQPRRAFLRTLYRRNVICIPTVLVARWCYEEVGTAFDETVLFYDYEMWIRIAGRFDVGFLNVFDASYRIHRAQTTHAVDRHFGEHRLALLDAVDPTLPKDFPPLDRRRARSGALLRIAVEELERGDRHAFFARFRGAARVYPVGLFDPKLASLVIGSMRRRALQRRLWG